MNTDPRGVSRGPCTSCACARYTRISSEVKCSTCSHPPGKHVNLSTAGSAGGTQYSQPSGSYSSPSYGGSGFAAPVQHASHYPPLTPPLPQCPASGCYNKVHYDSELGPFDYCSPECRDRHLLPKEQEKLRADIAKFSSDISSLPSGFVQPSDKHSHDVKGPYLNDCVELKKETREDLGIVVGTDAKGGLLITGVKVKSPAFKYFKEESIRFLDVIVELNGKPVTTPEAFQKSVWSKTLPRLKLKRCYYMPSPQKFIEGVEDTCQYITHIFVLSPQCVGSKHDFGFMTSLRDQEVKILIFDKLQSCAHQSGLTDNDVIRMYAQVLNKSVGTARELSRLYSTSSERDHKEFKEDVETAACEQKPLVLAVQKKAQSGQYY